MLDLARQAGLSVDKGLMLGLTGAKTRLANQLTLGLLRERLAKQYVIAARLQPDAPTTATTWDKAR